MKGDRDLANLLNRAAAALETPGDLTGEDKQELIKDLLYEALQIATRKDPEPYKDPDDPPPRPTTHIQTRGITTDIPPKRR